MKLTCPNARTLIPSYLDGEVSEEQAGPLRQHLLDCRACREVAKSETALKRWFEPAADTPAVEIPTGFAARVAQRAFAGEAAAADAEPIARALPPLDAGARARRVIDDPLPFVLRLTAVAAAALFVFAVAIQFDARPADHGVAADEAAELPELLEELDRLNVQAETASEAEDDAR